MSNRILLIDDVEHIRRMMRLTLEAVSYEVGEASDGEEGLRLYGDGSLWDAVVLDQRMPGMPESSFWTAEARRLLSDFLWNERGVPSTRRLVLSNLDPDKLPIAARWQAEEMTTK